MDRMKTFFKYFMIFVLIYVFSNLMIKAFLKVSFSEMTDYQIKTEPLFVDVTEAEVSNRNGHIYGIVKNTTESVVENKYLKFSMLSKNGNILGEKYIKIDKIEPNELKKYEVDFDYDNVKTFRIDITDEKPEEVDFIELIKNNVNDYVNGNVNEYENENANDFMNCNISRRLPLDGGSREPSEAKHEMILYGEEQIPTTRVEIQKSEALARELFSIYLQKSPSRFDMEKVFARCYYVAETPDGQNYAAFSKEKADLLRFVMKQASEQGNVTWRYMDGIFDNYERRGVRTVEDAISNEYRWNRGEIA